MKRNAADSPDASSSDSSEELELSKINKRRLNAVRFLRGCSQNKFFGSKKEAAVLLRKPMKRKPKKEQHAHHPEGCICCGRTECVSFHVLKRRQDLYKHLFPNASGKDKWCHECCKNCGSQAKMFGAVFCHRKDASSILFKTNCSLGWHTRFDPRCSCIATSLELEDEDVHSTATTPVLDAPLVESFETALATTTSLYYDIHDMKTSSLEAVSNDFFTSLQSAQL